MDKQRVYDLPTRVFHWLFAILFVVSFTIGNAVDDDSVLFSYHMISGIVLCSLVVLRIIWGFWGTKYARFSGFALNPRDLVSYLKGVLSGDSRKWAGHNPASSLAAILMMAFALGLGVSGYLMSSGQGGEDLEEVHELLANGFLIVVLLHIAGIILHSFQHKDGLWNSMITGHKSGMTEQAIGVKASSSIGVLLLIATIGFSVSLVRNFDQESRNLSLFGARLHLGEAEDEEHEHKRNKSRHASHRKHHHDDDDD